MGHILLLKSSHLGQYRMIKTIIFKIIWYKKENIYIT